MKSHGSEAAPLPPPWHKTAWGTSLLLPRQVLVSQQVPTVLVSCRYDVE